MAWNGSGTFARLDGQGRTGSTVWDQARAAGVAILSAHHDVHDQDLATGLNNCLTKDGQNAATAAIPFGAQKITGLGNGTARTDGTALGQLQDGAVTYAAATVSSSNVYVATLAPAITAYTTGMLLYLEFAAINTASATINVNSVGAKTIKDVFGNALIGGELVAGGCTALIYDGTDFLLAGNQPLRGGIVAVAQQTVTHDTWTQATWASGNEVFDSAGMLIDGSEKITLPTGTKAALLSMKAQVAVSGHDSLGVTVGYSPVATTPGTGGSTNFVQRASNHDSLPGHAGLFFASVSNVVQAPNNGSSDNGSYDVYAQIYVDKSGGSGTSVIAWEFSAFVLR